MIMTPTEESLIGGVVCEIARIRPDFWWISVRPTNATPYQISITVDPLGCPIARGDLVEWSGSFVRWQASDRRYNPAILKRAVVRL
jgi:hypothetical protein